MQLDIAIRLNDSRIDNIKLQRDELKKQFLNQPDLIKKYNNLQNKLSQAQKT